MVSAQEFVNQLKKKFYHWDTLRGVNWNYVKVVYELLQELKVPKHLWGQHFLAKHKIRQSNGWECGVAVVAIMRRIIEPKFKQSLVDKLKYGKFRLGNDLREVDFERERKELRKEYLQENKI